jgi:ankyrin repeat protein
MNEISKSKPARSRSYSRRSKPDDNKTTEKDGKDLQRKSRSNRRSLSRSRHDKDKSKEQPPKSKQRPRSLSRAASRRSSSPSRGSFNDTSRNEGEEDDNFNEAFNTSLHADKKCINRDSTHEMGSHCIDSESQTGEVDKLKRQGSSKVLERQGSSRKSSHRDSSRRSFHTTSSSIRISKSFRESKDENKGNNKSRLERAKSTRNTSTANAGCNATSDDGDNISSVQKAGGRRPSDGTETTSASDTLDTPVVSEPSPRRRTTMVREDFDAMLSLAPKIAKHHRSEAVDHDRKRYAALVRKKSTRKSISDATKTKFVSMLDLDPFQGEILSSDNVKNLSGLIKEYPQLCDERCNSFRAFPDDVVLPLHMLCALGAPISLIRQCLKANPKALQDNTTSKLGTPFHFACMLHHQAVATQSDDIDEDLDEVGVNSLALVKYLVKVRASGLTVQNSLNLQTPLHIACLAYQVDHNAKVRMYGYGEDEGEQSQQRVPDEKKEEVIYYIIQVCPKLTAVLDKNMNTPLHIACASMHGTCSVTTVKRLITAMSDTNVFSTTQNKDGATALHLALYNKAPYDLVKALAEENPEILQISDSKNRIPLHIAAYVKTDDIEVYKTLISLYPESLHMKNKRDETPYQIASKKGTDSSILKILQV